MCDLNSCLWRLHFAKFARGKSTRHGKKKKPGVPGSREFHKQVLEFVWINIFDKMEEYVFHEMIMWITDLSCLFWGKKKKNYSSAQDTQGKFIISAMSLAVIHVLLLFLIQIQYIHDQTAFLQDLWLSGQMFLSVHRSFIFIANGLMDFIVWNFL